MKLRKEFVILATISVAVLVVGSVIAMRVIGTANLEKAAEPVDVTGRVPRSVLLGSGCPKRGPWNARFILVEFADFQCPTCATSARLAGEMLARRTDLRVVFRHLPSNKHHAHAEEASRAAELAGRHGKFWEMHDALYKNQADWAASENFSQATVGLAASIGLDGRRFASELAKAPDSRFAERLKQDREAADACKVRGTPTYFLITPARTWAAAGHLGLEALRNDRKYWE